mmetsp:Transcript_18484/g.13291  ORF Transcript_18484/g.13291 Transcript_18484/m.13291 type:complete len:119 (+) Transcript_18484:1514-1870(+)
MKKNEIIDWRENPALNQVTKYAIKQFESRYSYNEYLNDTGKNTDDKSKRKHGGSRDANQQHQDASGGHSTAADNDNDENEGSNADLSMASEEDEEELVSEWNRYEAEKFYLSTRGEIE